MARVDPVSEANIFIQTFSIALGADYEPYVYSNGVYIPGERLLIEHIATKLGSDWSTSLSNEIIGSIRSRPLPKVKDKWDYNHINCSNGILELNTLNLLPHSSNYLYSTQLPLSWNPSSLCPNTEKVFSEMFSTPTVAYEIIGLLATTHTHWQKAVILVGQPGTGKTTFINLLQHLLGLDNISSVSLQKLDEERFMRVQLLGKLANISDDIPTHYEHSGSVFRQVVGEAPISAEKKYKEAFTFTPFARMVFTANEVPIPKESPEAMRRRWLPVEMNHKPDKIDPHLLSKLLPELEGLLVKGIVAYKSVISKGQFTEDKKGMERVNLAIDSLSSFLDECTEKNPKDRINRFTLYQIYTDWMNKTNRGKPLSTQRFYQRLEDEHCITFTRDSKGRYIQGLTLDPVYVLQFPIVGD